MFDKTATVLEMAVQTAMLHQDRCTKVRVAKFQFLHSTLLPLQSAQNHIYVRSPNGRWAVVPVDMKARQTAVCLHSCPFLD